MGRGDQLRRRRLGRRARIRQRERGVLDRRVPSRRPASRRHAVDQRRRQRRARDRAHRPPRARRGGGGAEVPRRRAPPQPVNDDDGGDPVTALTARRARAAAKGRRIYLVAENEPQDVRILTEYGLDAMWNADWHTAPRVALPHKREAYYTDYRGTANEFVAMARSGFLYQGQWYSWQKQRRGTRSTGFAPRRFVCFLQNHDQIANSADGKRIHQIASPADVRALTALLLLAPQTPMLFQGQECAASAPFLYFADHKPEVARSVAKGRRDFLQQ